MRPSQRPMCERFGVKSDALDTSYFLGRETLIPSPVPPMSRWQERLFILLSRNAVSATDFFRIPTDQQCEAVIDVDSRLQRAANRLAC